MINRILNIARLAHFVSDKANFNNSLPVSLQIIKKTQIGYLLRLGARNIEAQSAQNLAIGAKYWAILNENGANIVLTDLKKQPEIFEHTKPSIDLSDFRADKDGILKYHESALDLALNAQNREDFIAANNILLAFSQKILHFILKDKNRNILLQVKKSGAQKVDFSAVFTNLGIINGSVYGANRAVLKVQYEQIKRILEKNAHKLEGFERVSIEVEGELKLLFLGEKHALDIEA